MENGKNLLFSITLSKLEKRLKEFDFFRPTRSTLINLQYISDFTFDSKKHHIKNIQMSENRAPEIAKSTEGMQVKAINPDSGRSLKIRSIKRV